MIAAAPKNDRSAQNRQRLMIFFVGGLIVLSCFAAYHNTFSVPFVFDDGPVVKENLTIRQLWPLKTVLSPPHGYGLTVEGRPLINLSLAINYALGGTDIAGYHATNLAIHVLAALTLFGVVRRTLQQRRLCERFPAPSAIVVAGTIALLWALHPLQTEAVTYIVQRAESLMALCYLLTLYCFVRSVETTKTLFWKSAAVIACLLGMACKEVMVSAPLLVLFYDRAFVSGTFRDAWRRRRGVYLGLAAAWIVLGYLVIEMGGKRGGSAGFGIGADVNRYALTQCRALVLYLRLALWPHPLVFDYGTSLVTSVTQVVPQALVLLVLIVSTFSGFVRNSGWGFLGCAFFAVLAPSSSFVPVMTQTIAEHRMYLPLAFVISGAVLSAYAWVGVKMLPWCLVLAAILGIVTERRNRDYRSERTLWADTAAKVPGNARAHFNLGVEWSKEGNGIEEVREYNEALRLQPNYPEAYYNLANFAAKRGNPAAAMESYRHALRLQPDYAKAHYNLATLLLQAGVLEEATAHFIDAVRLDSRDAEAHSNLGNAFYQQGRLNEAVTQLKEAVRLRPDAAMHFNLGILLRAQGMANEANRSLEEALRLDPGYAPAREALKELRNGGVRR